MISVSEETRSQIKRILKHSFYITLIAVVCYLPLIANKLTNGWDGLWQDSYFKAGDWEISCGRWLWFFLDRFRGGYASEPFNTLLTLIMMAISSVLLLSLWSSRSTRIIYSLNIVISTTTCCYLSYRFQSPTFGVSFFLAVVAAVALIKGSVLNLSFMARIIVSSILLCLSLGLYQTNLGTFAAILVMNIMFLLLHGQKNEAHSQLLGAFIVGFASCLIYVILWFMALKIRHVSVTSYNGADSIGLLSILSGVPAGIVSAYRTFFTYHEYINSYYILFPIRILLALVVLALLFYKGIKTLRHDKSSLWLYIIMFLLLPLASSIYFLLTPGTYYAMIQMTGSTLIIMPMCLSMLESEVAHARRFLPALLGAVFLYGSIYAVGTDIDAMAQGTASATSIMENINATLIEKDLFGTQYKYVYIGAMKGSPLFRTNELWVRASDYARFGDFFTTTDCLINSYKGMMIRMGLPLHMASEEQYREYLTDPSTASMAVYPEEGSIIQKDDLVIIKVSDIYYRPGQDS